MIELDLLKVEQVLKEFFEKLKQQGLSKLTISDDFYWNVPVDEFTKFPNDPTLTVGSLKDDIEFIYTLVDEEYSTDYLELERLASIFRILSKTLKD